MRSLAARLLWTYLAAVVLTISLVSGGIWAILTWDMDLVTQRYLDHEIAMLENSLRFDAQGHPVSIQLPANAAWFYQSLASDLKFRVLDAKGHVVLSSDPGAQPLTASNPNDKVQRALFRTEVDGIVLHVTTLRKEKGQSVYDLQAATSQRLADLIRFGIGEPVVRSLFLIIILSVVLLGIALHFTERRMLRPLREASEAASKIEPRSLSTRLAAGSLPSELAPLAEAFNKALDRLEAGFRTQQEFLASAAHELKTPLSLIRGQLELDGTKDATMLLRDVDFMSRQVHQLLRLAEVSEAQNYCFEPTNVASTIDDVVEFAGRLADRRNVHIGVRCVPGMPALRADRGALFVLLKNLVENAIEHSPEGGVVSVIAEPTRLLVRDEGAGIAPEHLPNLFTRFWRGPDRRDNGAGLGLAICREITNAHAWSLVTRNRDSGAEFEVGFAPA